MAHTHPARGRAAASRTILAATCAALLLAASASHPSAAPPAEGPDLSAIFGPRGTSVRDTNGDGLADAVSAKVIVPASPTVSDSAAAANIAARLGFETTALSLPLVVHDADVPDAAAVDVPILVGRTNALIQQLIARKVIDLATLKPGQGLVALVPAAFGTRDAVIVVGGDDAGTLAAGIEAAARLPRAWNMSGITLGGLSEQLGRYLKGKGALVGVPAVTAVLVDSDRRGIATISLSVTAASAQAPTIMKALGDLDRAHRRGLEPMTLNFAEIANLEVNVRSGGKTIATGVVGRSGLNARTLTPPIDPNELAQDSPGDRGRPSEAGAATRGGKVFDLSSVYSISGWYGDAYEDLIPDRTDTSIIVGDASDAFGAGHVAARVALETTGVSLPLVKTDEEVREASREPNPILVGRQNRFVRDLMKIGRTRLDDLKPGEGAVHVVPNAFGNLTATVVAGADAAGTEAASSYLGRRVPYLWDTRRGGPSYDDLRTDVQKFLAGKSAAGQASQALHELDVIARDLEGKALDSFDVKLSLEAADPKLDAFLTEHLRSRLGAAAPVKVTSQAITAPNPVIDETIEVPWEVDDFWAKFRSDVLPKVKAGVTVDLETRLSESPAVRKDVADKARAELINAGAAKANVTVLSAYKQGFLWMTEQLIPSLKGTGASAIHVKVAAYKPDLSKKFKFYTVPSRWVHELYPVDEIAQRELGIPKARFSIELVDAPKDIYTVEISNAAGTVIRTATFSPKFVEREYLDKFPGWSRVEVTTGWLRASVDGQTAIDTRIATDPERFWNEYQSKILPRIYDHVMKVTDNRPLPDKQPFHRDLDIEVWMSEPDFRIGVDEELVSSLESMHEDLYFVTLDFYDALGRTTTKRRLAAPGKIYPIIHPDQPGKPGKVHVFYAANSATKPQLEVRYKERDAMQPERVARDLGRIDTSTASAVRAIVRTDAVSEIELATEAKDDREAGRALDAIDALGRLQAAGFFRTALSFEHVNRIALSVSVRGVSARRTVANTGTWAASNVRTAPAKPPLPLVKWDHIISPDESEELVGKLAAFPEVRAYKAGASYRGRDVSVAEITLPASGELVSLAKLTALKPTVFITGRQHANEVSSTSHILRLGELLVSDPSYRDILKKVNIVLQPVENPDGAAMAYELQKLTPTHMLHAGRYSALGMDVASQVGLADPLLPEALVRGRVWREWLPDIYLNPHGYPSHEWVQQFAGYVPPGFRTYWTTRGWYTTIGGLRDPRYPEHVEGTEALREAIVRDINSNADVRAMNLRHQERYRKWAFGFSPYVYGQEIYKDTAIYYTDLETGEPRGPRRAGASRFGGEGGGGGGRFSMGQWPQVTFVSGGTETPDETAQGDWLNLVTKPGFSYLMAHIKYLRDGKYGVERIEESTQRDGSQITLLRVRPVRPGPARPLAPAATPATTGTAGASHGGR